MVEPASGSSAARPRVLLLAMYRLDGQASGPTVRIAAMREALARRVLLEVVSGTRRERARRLARLLVGGGLRSLRGVYVESSTSLPGPADIAFLALARARGVRVVTYIRDAYQLFPEYYPATSLKRRTARIAFRPAVRTLVAASSTATFPSRGLARAVLGPRAGDAAPLLPPGARVADVPPVDPAAREVLYVGSLAHEASGGARLLAAMRNVRERGHDLRLTCVTPAGEAASGVAPEGWVRHLHASGPEIEALLPEVLLTVTPRPRSDYNDLAVPIKVMEYLGYARPMVVTDTTETAAIVRAAACGVVTGDAPEAIADGIVQVAAAGAAAITAWGAAARRAAETASWDERAGRVLRLLSLDR